MIATIAVIATITEKEKFSDHMETLSSDRSDNNP